MVWNNNKYICEGQIQDSTSYLSYQIDITYTKETFLNEIIEQTNYNSIILGDISDTI